MDAGILFTALSQQKEEIIHKHFKLDQIVPELVRTYQDFKFEIDQKIRKENSSPLKPPLNSEPIPPSKPEPIPPLNSEPIPPSKPSRSCW